MDSEDDEFLVEALECPLGTANNAGPSRDDGMYGSGAVGGNDDDYDVSKDDDTLILSSDDEEMRRQRAGKFNVGSDDDEEEDDDISTAVTVALSQHSSSSSSSENDDDADDDFTDYYCYGFSDDIVQKPTVDTFKPSDILQTGAISAGLFTGQPDATCSSDPF